MRGRVGTLPICLMIAALTLSACVFRPNIVSASSHKNNTDEVVELRLTSKDAARIKSQELYFSVVVVNCNGHLDRFPLEPYVEGRRATDFEYPTSGETVKITGSMPAKLFSKYRDPCVLLEGGGYFTGKLETPVVRISTASKPYAD